MAWSRVAIVAPLLYQQLFYAFPPPTAESATTQQAASVTTGQACRKTLFYQAKVQVLAPDSVLNPPATAESFSISTGQASRKTLFYQARVEPITVPVAVAAATVEWIPPLSKPLQRPPTETGLYTPFTPTIAPQVTADEWLPRWQGPPNYNQPLAGGSPFVPREAVIDNTVTPDAWLPRWQGPPRQLQPLAGGPVYAAVAPAASNLTTTLEWMAVWQGPKRPLLPLAGGVVNVPLPSNLTTTLEWMAQWRGPPAYHPAPQGGSPFVPKEAVAENTQTPDKWLPTWRGPPSYKPAPQGGAPFVPKEAVAENTQTPDAWMPRWQAGPRYLQPLAAGFVYPPTAPTAATNLTTSIEWLRQWQGPPRYTQSLASGLFYPPAGPTVASLTTTLEWMQAWRGPPRSVPAQSGGAPFVPKEAVAENTQTPDKWLRPLGTVPARYVPPKILAQPFVPREATAENTQTPEKWMPRWQGPPRYKLALPGGSPFIPKEAVLENTPAGTPASWLARFDKAVPVPKPVPTQPFFGYPYVSQAIVVPYEQWWHQPLSRAAARPSVHSKPYQPFVPREAVLQNTPAGTPANWLMRWQGPPRYTPLKVQAPTFYAPPAVDNTVTIDKWLQQLSRAARTPKARPTQPSVYLPEVVVTAVSAETFSITSTYPVRKTLFYQARIWSPTFVAPLAVTPGPLGWLQPFKGPPKYLPAGRRTQPFLGRPQAAVPDAEIGGPADEHERIACVPAASREAIVPPGLRDVAIPVQMRVAVVPALSRVVEAPLSDKVEDSNDYRDRVCGAELPATVEEHHAFQVEDAFDDDAFQ